VKIGLIIFMVIMTIIHLILKLLPDNKENKRGAMPFFEKWFPSKIAKVVFWITGTLLIICTIIYVLIIGIVFYKTIGII